MSDSFIDTGNPTRQRLGKAAALVSDELRHLLGGEEIALPVITEKCHLIVYCAVNACHVEKALIHTGAQQLGPLAAD